VLTQPGIRDLTASSGELEYPGAFLVGFFYAYGITTPIALATLYVMGTTLDPYFLAAFAAAGAVTSDVILLLFIEKKVAPDRGLGIKHPVLPRLPRS
jgi:hypothetical protein